MVVDLPLLRKDFVIDPYQIVEARAWGADAVLLIAAALERRQLSELQSAARELDMECLVEVHEVTELDRIDFDQTGLLGINNRNLKTLEVDVRQTRLIADLVPTGTTIISESGLQSGSEIADLIRRGIDGFLVGTSLMKAHDPGEALNRLLAQTQKSLLSPQPLRRVAV
jgi:indole-3-glycerol phosphate synthase